MEERIKRFDLLSDLYRFSQQLSVAADRRRETFQWLLEYAAVNGA